MALMLKARNYLGSFSLLLRPKRLHPSLLAHGGGSKAKVPLWWSANHSRSWPYPSLSRRLCFSSYESGGVSPATWKPDEEKIRKEMSEEWQSRNYSKISLYLKYFHKKNPNFFLSQHLSSCKIFGVKIIPEFSALFYFAFHLHIWTAIAENFLPSF